MNTNANTKRIAHDAVLTKPELAERLGVSTRTISQWVKRGVRNVFLNTAWVGARQRIAWADYLAFQEEVDRRRGVFVEEDEGDSNE